MLPTIAIIRKLEKAFRLSLKKPTPAEFLREREFIEREGMKGWECFFMPETGFYQDVLAQVSSDDVIFDVGAGDLRFDLMLSDHVKKVYAIEINPVILGKALKTINWDMPENLIAIRGNAFKMELPSDVTIIVALMIHRKHAFHGCTNGSSTAQRKACRYVFLQSMWVYIKHASAFRRS